MKEISASSIPYPTFISTVPSLDIGLGGGLMRGGLITIESKSAVGKSTLASFLALQAQRQFNIPSVFIAAEYRSLNNRKFIDRCGIDTPLSTFMKAESAEDLVGMKILSYIEQKLKSNNPYVIVLDSIQALSTEKEVTEGMEASDPGRFAYMIGKFAKLAAPLCSLNLSTVILLKQHRASMAMNRTAPAPQGGYQLEHSVDTELKLYAGDDIKKRNDITGDEEDVGFNIKITIEKSPCSKPVKFGKNMVEIAQFYHNGIDLEYNVIDYACSAGLIESAGAGWHTIHPIENLSWPTEEIKLQGRFNTVELIRQHPEYVEYLTKECHNLNGHKVNVPEKKKRGKKELTTT